MLNSVIELAEYVQQANKLFEPEEQNKIINYLAEYPESGSVIPGTGGVRKLRWKYGGKGKRGGVRIIYYYYNENFPVVCISLFPKNQKGNLTKAEEHGLAKLVETLKKNFITKK